MAYFSDVYIQCEEKAFELFKEVLIKNKGIPTARPDDIRYSASDKLYTIVWRGVMWYTHFGHVQDIHATMKCLDALEDTPGYAYKYIQVGEDHKITEEQNESWYDSNGQLEVEIRVRDYGEYTNINVEDVINGE